MIIAIIVVATLSFGMLWFQRDSGRDQEYLKIVDALRLQSLGLDALLKDAANHVELLHSQTQNHLSGWSGGSSEVALLRSIQQIPGRDIYALDQVPWPYQTADTGNLTGIGSLASTAFFQDEMLMALSLNPIFRATKRNIPNAAWVYYTSANKFIIVYPHVPSKEFAMSDEILRHEFFTGGRPEKNPSRGTFWTSAYIDEAGKGLMVTCGKPVDRGNQYLGTVSIDLTLYFLNEFVRNFDAESGTAFLVNDQNQLLAHPTLISSQDKSVKMLKDALPESLQTVNIFQMKPLAVMRSRGETYTHQRLSNAPWNMVLVMNKKPLAERVFSGLGVIFLILLAGFALLFIAASRVVYSEFVRPAGRLVAHIEAASVGSDSVPELLPEGWKPWFESVSAIFQKNRDLMHNLEAKVRERTEEITKAKEKSDRLLKLLREDLRLARKVQENMMPFVQDSAYFKVLAAYMPQGEVGGDLYDVHFIRPDFIRVFIADATGHGVQAALVTMAIKADYENLKNLPGKPGKLLALMNRQFYSKYSALNSFYSCLIADVDLGKRELTYAAAGHPSQILIRVDGIHHLHPTGRLMGILEDSTFQDVTLPFDSSDRLHLFTDGATEEFSNGLEFGEDRFSKLLVSLRSEPIGSCMMEILAELDRFLEGSERQDDLTLVILEGRKTSDQATESASTDAVAQTH